MGVSAIANTKIVTTAPTANAASITVNYPTGTVQATLNGSTGGKLVYKTGEVVKQGAGGVTFTFGASNITVTNDTGAALPAGEYWISFGEIDINGSYNLTRPKKIEASVA